MNLQPAVPIMAPSFFSRLKVIGPLVVMLIAMSAAQALQAQSFSDGLTVTGGNTGLGTSPTGKALTVAGEIQLTGYPTGLYFGNSQGLKDNGNGGLTLSTFQAGTDITIAPTGTLLINGAAPSTVGVGQVAIGGGMVYAKGQVNAVANMNAAGYGLNFVGTGTGDYRALGRTSASAIMLRSYSSNEGGNGNLVLASADNNGIYEFLTVLGGSGPFGIFQGNDPGATVVGQVRVGGGVIRAAGAVIVGVDPGGSETLRVGGTAHFFTALDTRPGNVDTPRLVQAWRAAGTPNYSYGTGWDVALGNNGASSSTGADRERSRLVFRARTGADNWASFTNALEVSGNGMVAVGGLSAGEINGAATKRHILLGFNVLGSGTYAIQPIQETIGYPTLSLNERGGNVQIGDFTSVTPAPLAKLSVAGTISAKEIKVTTTGADYVFDSDYKLRSLAEVEKFIAKEKHLPEMMSAKVMQADGMPVSEVVTKQLAKIEELTLYAIEMNRKCEDLEQRMKALEKILSGNTDHK